MTKSIVFMISLLALITTTLAVRAAEQTKGAPDDCEAKIQKLEDSNAEGDERLALKNEIIDFCAKQYKGDKTIEKLVTECSKYEEQAEIKQQFVAECQLAAFGYANALKNLKEDYGK
jgi:hypothetical protein